MSLKSLGLPNDADVIYEAKLRIKAERDVLAAEALRRLTESKTGGQNAVCIYSLSANQYFIAKVT